MLYKSRGSPLSLKWIDIRDLHLEGWELDNYSIIDSKSLGGVVRDVCLNEQQANILKPYLLEIAESKQRKVFCSLKIISGFLTSYVEL